MKEPRLFCRDKARTHRDSKLLTRGQRFNANVSVLCASSLSRLLIKSLFLFLFHRSKAFDLLNPLYLVRCSSLSSSITTGLPGILLKHRFRFGAHRDFAQPEFILAHAAHLPPPTPCPHFVKRCLLTCIDEDINSPGETFSWACSRKVALATSVPQSKHSWATAAQI